MKRRVLFLMAVCLLLLPTVATAQESEPTYYTFVAQWAIAREQWTAFTSHFEQNIRPVMERMANEGALVGWGAFEVLVHGEDGITHGTWWVSRTVAGIERTRIELLKLAPIPAMTSATRHEDYFLSSLTHGSKPVQASTGYLYVSSYMVKPGRGGDWKQLWDRFTKPVYDELLANGTVLFYGIDAEDVHLRDPGLRFVVYVTPNAEAEDKVAAAFEAANAKRSAEERRAIGTAFADVLEPGTHRDFFSRVVRFSHK